MAHITMNWMNKRNTAYTHTLQASRKENDSIKMNIMLNKKRKEKSCPHSGTFGCSTASANASQPQEPSFCHRIKDSVILMKPRFISLFIQDYE